MSGLFEVKLIKKSQEEVELEVLQTHPDAGNWESFLQYHLMSAVSLPAFNTDTWPPVPSSPLGQDVGWDNLADSGLEAAKKYFDVKTAVLRDVYNDDYASERLAEAGLAGQELTRDNVRKICGRMKLTLSAKEPKWLEHFGDVGTDWEIA